MSMKKTIISLISALTLTVPVLGLAACGGDDGTANNPPISTVDDSIRLNSESEQALRVGDEDKIIYDAKADGKVVKNGVNFVSSDPSVIRVDEYGNIEAVGVGKATVTLTLKNNENVTAKVNYTVTKTFFMTKVGYCNGNVDLSTAELDGWVHVAEGEQAQLLVSECAEQWYFSAKIEHSGRTGQDSSGRWGVGSFLVDDAHALGNVMMWFGFQPTNHATQTYTPYVGGWRVMSGGNDPEITISTAMENANIATLEIIRNGIDHYCTVTVGNRVEKYVYSCPSLAGIPTYPGVYSQRQELYLSEYKALVGEEQVLEKLNNFQVAEKVAIDGLSSKLYAGDTYDLKATVSPDTTYNKNVTFALKEPVEGVSITEAGALTIGTGVTGEVTVVATATSGDNVTAEKTYTVIAKTESAHDLFDTNMILGEEGEYTLGDDSITFPKMGDVYVPLKEQSSKWAVSFNGKADSGKLGVYSVKSGYTDYVSVEIDNGYLLYGMRGSEKKIACNTAATNAVTFARDGSFYYIAVNGRLVDRFYAPLAGDTIPVIYGSAIGIASDVTLASGEAADEILGAYKFTVGKYVTDNGDGSYTIAAMQFTDPTGKVNDINWPPVNNYENGLKFANTVKGDFTIEFDMIDARPLAVGGKIDSKILIYLKSETKTASLQIVFKSDDANVANAKIAFCPNLNDATWTEYDTDLGFLRQSPEEPIHITVVKRADVVEFYVEHIYLRQFEGNPGLNNLGYWDENTECTPGIGTFNCGLTVSNLKLTVGSKSPVDDYTPPEPPAGE